MKNLTAAQETQAQSIGQEDPWRRECLLTSVFFPGLASPMHLVGVPMSSQPKPWIKMLEETVLRTEPFWHITFPLGRELHFVQYCAYDITND